MALYTVENKHDSIVIGKWNNILDAIKASKLQGWYGDADIIPQSSSEQTIENRSEKYFMKQKATVDAFLRKHKRMRNKQLFLNLMILEFNLHENMINSMDKFLTALNKSEKNTFIQMCSETQLYDKQWISEKIDQMKKGLLIEKATKILSQDELTTLIMLCKERLEINIDKILIFLRSISQNTKQKIVALLFETNLIAISDQYQHFMLSLEYHGYDHKIVDTLEKDHCLPHFEHIKKIVSDMSEDRQLKFISLWGKYTHS